MLLEFHFEYIIFIGVDSSDYKKIDYKKSLYNSNLDYPYC